MPIPPRLSDTSDQCAHQTQRPSCQHVSACITHVVAPLYHKNPHMALMMDWSTIVGSTIAAYAWPAKIVRPGGSQGLLYLHVRQEHALQAWADTPIIITRVNQHFGYQAIDRVRFSPPPPVSNRPQQS